MKKTISLLLIFSMFLSLTVYGAENNSTAIEEYAGNEIFVMYNDNSFEVISFEDETEFSDVMEALSGNDTVSFVQPNYTYTQATLSSDPLVSKQWALENDGTFFMEEQKNEYPVYDTPFGDMFLPGFWEMPDFFGIPGGGFFGFSSNHTGNQVNALEGIDINLSSALDTYKDSGREVIVAMVDTGIDYTHEELSGRIWTNDDETADNGIDDDNNGYVDDIYGWNFYNNNNSIYTGSEDDHGTHGAGTIVAKADNGIGISGIAQSGNIKVMAVKALGGINGSGSTASVIQAIQYAEKNGAQICNLSLGTSTNDRALYETMANSNMLFVVAAGNDGINTDRRPSYPASYELENIISVANLNYDGTLNYSSNYGKNSVDIAAPGSYILSTTSGNDYSYMSGTSMAAPMVSGAAAVVYSHFENSTLADVKNILISSASKLESLENAVLSGGMPDLAAALNFNTSELPEEQWEVKTPVEYKGKAPVIQLYMSRYGQSSYLTVKAVDEDNDLSYVSYANGQQTTDYFNAGNEETAVELGKSNTAYLELEAGTYTFYAVDSKGNETVSSVTLTRYEQPKRQPQQRKYITVDFEELFRYFMPGFFR